jgi:hypothetical protein
MATNAGTAFLTLQLRGKKKVNKDLQSMNDRLKRFGGAIKGIAAALATAFVVRKSADFLGSAIKQASDMQETMNKFNVVFGQSSAEMKKFSDEMAAGFGRSKQQIADFLSSSQDLLVPMGLSADAATGMSKGMAALAMDLGSFNNMADASVMTDLHAALTGSGEVMKKYGVIVSESAVKQELLNNNIEPTKATDAQKAMARYNLILAGTTAAQGDTARSSDSFANQTKAITAQISDLMVTIGEKLLPIIETWLEDLQAAFSLLGDVGEASDGSGTALDSLTDILKNMMSPVEMLIRYWKYLTSLWKAGQSLATELAEKIIWLSDQMVALAINAQELAENINLDLGIDTASLKETRQMLQAQKDDLDKLGKKQWAEAGAAFETFLGGGIRKSLDKAKKAVKISREKAKKDLTKIGKEAMTAAGGGVAAATIKSGANIESLEATSAAAFNKFFQIKQDAELDELQKINKNLKNAPVLRQA